MNLIQSILKDLKNHKSDEKKINQILTKISNYREEVSKSLHQEILEEIAYSLRRKECQMKEYLEQCKKILNEYNQNPDEYKRNEYNQTRKKYLEERWKYIIQREALGHLWTEILEKQYPYLPDIKIEK